MVNNILIGILDVVLAFLLGYGIKYGAPYLKIVVKNMKFDFIKKWVDTGIKAAEQKVKGSKMGPERKDWLIDFLENVDIIADKQVDALIESGVKTMNSTIDAIEDTVIAAVKEVTKGKVTEEVAEQILDEIYSKLGRKRKVE